MSLESTNRMASVAIIVIALALALLVAAYVLGDRLGAIHRSAGCNHIPIVNGQPVHGCAVTP